MPYKQLTHPLCNRTSNPSSLNIKWFFPLHRDSLLLMVFMIIPFPLSKETFLPISIPIVTPFPKKIKLRKWFKNYSTYVLSALVQAPTLLPWSWSLRNKVLGACVLTFVPSTNSPLKKKFPFLSLRTSWINWVAHSFLLNLIFILATTRYVWMRKHS